MMMMMNLNKLISVVVFVLVYSDCNCQETELKVSLYYEALCPDCKDFFVQQLYPAYKVIGQYLKMDLVPYGFATASNATGKWVFNCQHGPKECYSNRVQSCAVALLDQHILMEYINCIEKSKQCCKNMFVYCARSQNITYDSINKCVVSSMGDSLMVKNEERTNAVTPPIQSVPTVVFNDAYNDTNQNAAMINFFKTACSLMDNKPKECKKQVYGDLQDITLLK